MKKRISSLIVIIAFLILCMPLITHAEIISSGTCGANEEKDRLTWELDNEGILTISGTGNMKDYYHDYNYSKSPWQNDLKIQSVIIEEGVKNISAKAFSGCSLLTSVTISDSVTSIGFGAFDGTAYQQDVTNWDNGVLYISNYLIATNPDEIPNNYIIKEGTKVVAKYAFSQLFEDFNFTSISIPSSMLLESLEYMFDSNKIPDTLSRIDIDSQEVPYGFASGCTNIARVNIGSNVQSIGKSAFEGCTNLRFLTMAEGVKTISQNAFSGCSSLSELTIPSSVKTISQNAFSGCYKIKEVIIPSTVTSIIGDGVFSKSTILCGCRGSAAEEYAANYGYEFHVIDEDSYITSSTAKRSNGVIVLNTDINQDISKKLLHIALYNAEGVLLDYMMIPTTKSNNNAYVVFKDNPNASYAKVFVWNSAVSMKPEANAEKVLIQ